MNIEFKKKPNDLKKKKSLLKLINILEKKKIKYFIEGGLFLGAVRDKKFIDWDRDFEIGLFYEDVKDKILSLVKIFSKEGFKILYVSNLKETMKINVSLYDGIKISLIPYYRENGLRKRYSWKIPEYVFDNLSRIKFLGKKISCPHYDYLDFTYGNWKKVIKSNYSRDYINPEFARKNYFLKILFKLKEFVIFFFRFRNYLFKIFYGRENNFAYVIKKNLKKNTLFIDIGSSDGYETKLVLDKYNSTKSFIFEPHNKNRKKILKKLNSKLYKDRFKILNYCISDKNSKVNFYVNSKKPNLNSLYYFKNSNKIVKKSITFDKAAKKFNFETPIFIKADIEGGEEQLLNGAKKFLHLKKNISLLLELHPDKYKNNNFKKLIQSLISNGYKIKYVESSGRPEPMEFKKRKFRPFRVFNNRGLYKNIHTKFVLNNAFRENFYLSNSYKKGFGNKIIRFIYLCKN